MHYKGDRNAFFADLGSKISTGVIKKLEERSYEDKNLEELLDFSLRAYLITRTYAVAKGNYKNFDDFMIEDYLERT